MHGFINKKPKKDMTPYPPKSCISFEKETNAEQAKALFGIISKEMAPSKQYAMEQIVDYIQRLVKEE